MLVPRMLAAQSIEARMNAILDQVTGYTLFEIKRGLLSAGERNVSSYEIPSGSEVMIFALCDDECSDINLEAASRSGKIAEHLGADARPLIGIPRHSGLLGVRVTMVRCAAATCAYRVVVLTR